MTAPALVLQATGTDVSRALQPLYWPEGRYEHEELAARLGLSVNEFNQIKTYGTSDRALIRLIEDLTGHALPGTHYPSYAAPHAA